MTWEQMELFSDKELGIKPGIIGLSGYAQSGKDTVADILVKEYGYKRLAFADNVRKVLYDLNPFVYGEPLQVRVDAEGWENAKKEPLVRILLQSLGEAVRKHISNDAWIIATFSSMDAESRYVIPDVRFTNEADIIKVCGGQVWRVSRPGVGPINRHISEVDMDSYEAHKYIQNEGSLEDLETIVKGFF